MNNNGARLYIKAKQIIPGGTQLLSKRPEMFLPDKWPNYYRKAKGIELWDLDGNRYLDFCIMGIGTCSLGYANNAVSKAVKQSIDDGSMCTLNCHEEVELAEKLIELHPFAEMVRFSRTGGEALAIAIRIARAASGKSKVALCGYHGWHDWYLASNLSDDGNIDGLLMPGLDPAGIPKNLKNTALPFHYGKIDELKSIISKYKNEIGVIILEVQRNRKADLDFLKEVKQIAGDINAVLIFDEVSSGFRLNIGGVHQLYGIEPDICVLGKALGNGHPISAIIGRRSVMESAQNTFISSSYWTERVGFTAGLAVLREFKEKKVIEHLKLMGEIFNREYNRIFKELNLNISVDGMLTVPTLIIKEEKPLVIKTLFTQEMLKRGYLASNITYLSLAHNENKSKKYFENAYNIFNELKKLIQNDKLESKLDGPVCHSGFKRLT